MTLYPVRTVKAKEVVGRCFICGTPLTRNRWVWRRDRTTRRCRNRPACTWRHQHGIRDTIEP